MTDNETNDSNETNKVKNPNRKEKNQLVILSGWLRIELGIIQPMVMAGLQAQSFKLAATLLPLLFEDTVLWRLFFRHLQTMTQLTLKQC